MSTSEIDAYEASIDDRPVNTKKGLVRKRKRMDEKAKQELRAKQLKALALKTFKVSVITMGMHNFTIMALNDQDAIAKVMAGHGRDAGKEGPVPFAHRVQDMSVIMPPVTLAQVMGEIGRGEVNVEAPQPEPLIKPGA